MRLIDVDRFLEDIVDRCGCVPYVESRHGETIIIKDLINEQPTAYDADKVVDLLGEYPHGNYSDDYGQGFTTALNLAIRIVKAGGIEEEKEVYER